MSLSPSPTEAGPLDLAVRQIWAVVTSSPDASMDNCSTFSINAPGLLVINSTFSLNITDDAHFHGCGVNGSQPFNATIGDNGPSDDPYFASTSPVIFVLGICVTVAWTLLVMLLMTPRTYLTGIGSSRRRPDEGINVVGLGSRPWFQKVATFFVAVALLLAVIKTFDAAADQYNEGYQDSGRLTSYVLGSKEIRVIRFVSTLFEWLAQAQTALRLFPRHRERVAIKWVALSLILLEMIFGIINNFTEAGMNDVDEFVTRPRRYLNPFPALQYLFEVALSLMYAAVLCYYSLTKRRFAFYHPEMYNISLVALLSITAVLVPIVFFVLDIAVPNISAWGDYVRWVGAAAASVIVWEWVERIEALEREERKDGILGQEIFEADDMFSDPGRKSNKKKRKRKRETRASSGEQSPVILNSTPDSSAGSLKKHGPDSRTRYGRVNKTVLQKIAMIRSLANDRVKKEISPSNPSRAIELQPPAPAVRRRRQREPQAAGHGAAPNDRAAVAQTSSSPVSRSDCTSASTVYRVVHHCVSPSSTPGISETLGQTMNVISPVQEESEPETQSEGRRSFSMANVFPFRRRSSGNSTTVPPEILAQQAQLQASAASLGKKSKKSGGFLSRFRRAVSEERELPELVIPWRGENARITQTDLESGLGTNNDSYHEADAGDEDHAYRAEYRTTTSPGGTPFSSEDATQSNRASSRPFDNHHFPP